jgi:hypothetical protein
MVSNKDQIVSIVIPNWNGKDSLAKCLDSLLAQSVSAHIIVVENGSIDGSLGLLQKNYPQIETIIHERNKGFSGGVNAGIKSSIQRGDTYVALFNNDAVADKYWLEKLINDLDGHQDSGISTCKLVDINNKHLDSTGDFYTVWGLPYPRGRGEPVSDKYDNDLEIFSASGGASLYRVKMLEEIGLFDEDFFAYYEDVDLSFRAQLAGWKVRYTPAAIAYHQIGATSAKIKGFTTYATIKNLPWLFVKNVPYGKIYWRMKARFTVAYLSIIISALSRGQITPVFKGLFVCIVKLPKKVSQRIKIQKSRKVSNGYIWVNLHHDLPPNAAKLRRLRSVWRKSK